MRKTAKSGSAEQKITATFHGWPERCSTHSASGGHTVTLAPLQGHTNVPKASSWQNAISTAAHSRVSAAALPPGPPGPLSAEVMEPGSPNERGDAKWRLAGEPPGNPSQWRCPGEPPGNPSLALRRISARGRQVWHLKKPSMPGVVVGRPSEELSLSLSLSSTDGGVLFT